MTLAGHLDDIRSNLRDGLFVSEASVSQNIVRRLLDTLGWPIYNPQVTVPEYSVEGRRVDYALCHPPQTPLVFIEVKPVGQIAGAERQLFEYAFHRGVPIAILTDGREWRFFHPGGQGNYRERRVCKLDLIDTENEEISTRLNRYLSYESIRTGAAARAIQEDYQNISRQRQIETRLPEAWSRLIKEVDELLIEVVAEKTEGLCGHRPTNEQVLAFLRSLRFELPPETSAPAPTPEPFPPGPIIKDPIPDQDFPSTKKPPTCLHVTMPDGTVINYPTAIRTFAEVIERIGIDQVRRVYPGLISSSPSPQHGYLIGQHYIKAQTNTLAKKQMLDTIAGRLGIQLEVKIVPRN